MTRIPDAHDAQMISTCRRKSPDFCVYTWKSSRTNSRRNETTARFCWTISFPCLYINAFCTAFLGLRDIIHGFLLVLSCMVFVFSSHSFPRPRTSIGLFRRISTSLGPHSVRRSYQVPDRFEIFSLLQAALFAKKAGGKFLSCLRVHISYTCYLLSIFACQSFADNNLLT
jgi:hypothetical protein